jgi:hypothetical protein
MHRKDKIGIGRIIARAGTVPRFAAMLPSHYAADLHLVFMSHADDMRTPTTVIEERDPEPAGDQEVTSAAALVRELHIKEADLSAYPTPSIQQFYANLKALALEQGRALRWLTIWSLISRSFRREVPFLRPSSP